MDYKDYYKTLGVAKTATADEIKKSYRKLARQYHPDINQEAGAEDKVKEVNQAYEVLKNKEKRAAYDQMGADWNSGGAGDWSGGRGSQGFSGHDFNDFFESVHQEIHLHDMRGAVCLVGEVVKNNIALCGVGDLSLWLKKKDSLLLKTFKSGIIGEVFSSVEKFAFTLQSEEFCVMTTDGIEQRKMEYFKDLLMAKYSAYFIAFTMHHFTASKFDDSSLLVIKN